MCGISGMVNFDPRERVSQEVVARMTHALRHRGPDDEGLFCDDNVALGHRRLSIIDLKGGHQPIFNEDRTICAVVNGEIYNYQELRTKLQWDHIFSTDSDSEVIVHLWESFGDRCVDYLRGMFAFALYDMNRNIVLLARDRFGQKPLVYAETPEGVYFCSEIYPIAQLPHVDTGLCYEAMDDFFSLHYIPAPCTIYNGIKKLPPGHTLSIAPAGVTTRRYWSVDPCTKCDDTYAVAERRVCELIEASVQYRMIADVPVGAFLSGGVDSSIIVAFMREVEPASDIQTVCIGFDEQAYDERAFARRVARQYRTRHHEHVVKPDMVQILPEMVRHYGEPYGDPSAIPTFCLSRVTAGHVKVALSGDGGDEIFGGYNRLDSTALVEIYQKLPEPFRKNIIEPTIGRVPDMCWGECYVSQLKHFMKSASLHPTERFVARNSVFSEEMKKELYSSRLKDVLREYHPSHRFLAAYQQLPRMFEAERVQHIDLGIFLPDDILAKVDIASMAHGLEVRCPFLDHKLAEYVIGLPFSYKHRILRRKRLLKSVGSRFFEAHFLHRKKKGFRLPIGEWFRESLREVLRQSLTSAPIFTDSALFERQFLRRLLDEHQEGKVNHTERLWNLWFLGEWSKEAAIRCS